MNRRVSGWMLALTLAVTAGGSCNLEEDSWDGHALYGVIKDANDAPVEGALVTADGVSAEHKTDINGLFFVKSPFIFGDTIALSVYKAGYVGVELMLDRPDVVLVHDGVAGGSLAPLSLASKAEPKLVTIASPAPDEIIDLGACCSGKVTVRGAVAEELRTNMLLDVAIVIDVSGSVGEKGIFAAELAAARSLVSSLTPYTTRVGVVRFASAAVEVQGLTEDLTAVNAALDQLASAGPTASGVQGSGTDYADALKAAERLLSSNGRGFPDKNGQQTSVEPARAVVFISDGIPTLPAGSGMTQEKADINASLAQARNLAAKSIPVHAYALGIGSADLKLTTLPSIAAITGGSYTEISDPAQATLTIGAVSFVGVETVDVKNSVTGERIAVPVGPDGFFELELGILKGTQELSATAVNVLDKRSGTVAINIVGQTVLDRGEPVGLASQPVAIRGVRGPSGQPLGNNYLQGLLTGTPGDYKDAVESIGTEVFAPAGLATQAAVLRGEFVMTEACYKSDIGFLIVDPANLVASTKTAFAAAKQQNVLFNTSQANVCGYKLLSPGQVPFQISVPAGSAVVFFLVSNGKLKDGQQGKQPVFYTVSGLNPAGFDQALTFYSAKGRKGAGGPVTVIAFEDISQSAGVDLDFNDVVFHVSGWTPSAPVCSCK